MGSLKEGDERNEEREKNKNGERKYIPESYHKTESILTKIGVTSTRGQKTEHGSSEPERSVRPQS